MTAQLHIGTSGWSFPGGEGTWKGHFYPTGTRDELVYYSQFFNAVEINTTFYQPLNPTYSERWVKKTPPDFKFTAKLWQKFTHPDMYTETTGEVAVISRADVDIFRRGLDPLSRAGKLGAVLAQFPPGFKNEASNQQLLKAVMHTFNEYPLAFELRHRSWSDDPATTELFAGAGATWVGVDEPIFSTSIASEIPLTSSLAYFRFHGRNYQDWRHGNVETRYRYLYSEPEIDQLAGRVKQAARKAKLLFAFFNNHWQGYAPKNAVELKGKLGVQEPSLGSSGQQTAFQF
jgi:uncharacterized protein YecE (DUF72 family)